MKTKKLIKCSAAVLAIIMLLVASALVGPDFAGEFKAKASTAVFGEIIYEINDKEITITGCDSSIRGALIIPDSIEGYRVTEIGDDAFFHCDEITSVEIPDSVKIVEDCAFSRCTKLESVKIGKGVSYIGAEAFMGCDGLKTIKIPKNVKTIGDCAFSLCTSLKMFSVSEDNGFFSNDKYGALYNKNKTELIQYPAGSMRTSFTTPDSVVSIANSAFKKSTNLKTIKILNNVKIISYSAFEGCSALESVCLPDGLKEIPDFTFCGCTKLANIKIPDSVKSIGDLAFRRCKSLTAVEIPKRVKTIGMDAFCNCESLESISIPASVKNIGYWAFSGCKNLKTVFYQGTKTQWKDISVGTGNKKLTNAVIYYNCPEQVTGLKVSDEKTTSLKLTWSKTAGAKYYKVEQSTDGKKWKTVTTTDKTSYTVKSLKAGTKYQFRVTALDSTKKIAGKASSVLKTGTLTSAPTLTLKSAKSKTATASWKKVTGASKYAVYKSTNGKKWTKVTTTTKTSYTLTKLTGGKKIYVRVTALNAYSKASAYSSTKNVTVKK